MRLDKLKKISKEWIGAVDGCTPYIGKYTGPGGLTTVLTGNTDWWLWKSISAKEAENVNPLVIFFAKYEKVQLQGISSTLIQKVTGKKLQDRVNVAIYGVLVNNILFLQDKYRSKNLNLDFCTDDEVEIKRLNTVVRDCYVMGYFNLQACSFYCDVRLP